ncbi:ClpP/crotonase-like domain-containing protein [Jimgerdemannia flammicorona]|uniref:ClpP/crotonase-like domain-containing protein n=1 Tax=Jimgerdemannia flammicorona TaxID=994334 RepID=A0A433Q4C9_9FUNG|nr:ClpP/crotonase-like domain-containing protein [Jimgerdemannia flammicorona]
MVVPFLPFSIIIPAAASPPATAGFQPALMDQAPGYQANILTVIMRHEQKVPNQTSIRLWLVSKGCLSTLPELHSHPLPTTMHLLRHLNLRSILSAPRLLPPLASAHPYTTHAHHSHSSASFLSPHDPLPTIREQLRAIGEGSVDFNPDHAPGVALITLNNPAKHNALSGKMMAELADVVDTLEKWTRIESMERTELVGIVLTGSEGKSFCAGLDLSAAKSHLLTPTAGLTFSVLMQHTLTRLRNLPLFSVAGINGPALGGGAELATACDHRCMPHPAHKPAARIQFVQVKMGVTPGWGGGARLVELVGRSRALRLLGSTELVDATMGEEIGLVDVVAKEDESVVQAATKFLGAYVGPEGERNPVEAVRGMKRIVANATRLGAVTVEEVESAQLYEREVFGRCWGSEANLRAVNRPREKKR